jgi:hypothetical protein
VKVTVVAPPLQRDILNLKRRIPAAVASRAGKFLGRIGCSDRRTLCLYEFVRDLEAFSISQYVLYEDYKNILLE